MKKDVLLKLGADLLMLVSFGVFIYGLWLAWHPLGFIVGGLLACAAAFFYGYSASNLRSKQ